MAVAIASEVIFVPIFLQRMQFQLFNGTRIKVSHSNGQDWQSVGPCRVYALAPIRPIDLGIRILQVRSGISMAGFMLGSVRNRQSMK